MAKPEAPRAEDGQPRGALPVAAVRDELVRLGYLQDGVDRYFLDDLGIGQGTLHRCLRGAARGAPPLALPLAAGAATLVLARNPAAGGAASDGLVLALYLIAPALVAAFVLLALLGGLGAALASAARPPDPGLLARGVSVAVTGLTVAIAVAVLSGAPQASWATVGGRAVVLSALAFLTEHLLHDELLALLVGLEGRAPRRRRTGNARMAALVLVLAGGATLLASLGASRPAVPGPAPGLPVDRVAGRTFVLAVDGFDETTVDYLTARGELTTLSRVRREAVELRYARREAPPPETWTTIWTGVSAEHHGLRAYEWARPRGLRRVLVDLGPLSPWLRVSLPALGLGERGASTATQRRAAALWEITARAGYATLQVGNWASGPASPFLGRSLTHQGVALLASGGSAAGQAHPADLAATADDLAARIPQGLLVAEWLNAFELNLADGLWADGDDDVAVVYLPGLDLLRDPGSATGGEPALLRRAEAVERTHATIDAFLARLVATLDPERDRLALIADPGRWPDGRPEGFVYLLGAWGVAAGPPADTPLRTVDVLPTLLSPLGIPLSAELEGVPAAGLGERARTVARYPPPPGSERAPAGGEPAEDYLEVLRSLGYVR